jgi:putative permease
MARKILLIISLLFALYASIEAPSIIATFLTSLAFAYLLQPLAKKLTILTSISYCYTSLVVYILFMTILVTSLIYIIPEIIEQVEKLISKLPEYHDAIVKKLIPSISKNINELGGYNFSKQINKALEANSSNFGGIAGWTASYLWSWVLSTINLISMCLLFPILLLFFLKDWNQITESFKNFLSGVGFDALNQLWDEADDLVAGFIKALFNVSIILSVFYTAALSFIGFEFSLIIGILSGFAVMIPFIGAVIAITITISISLLTHGFDAQQLWILVVYMIGQTLDSSVFTPKIVGDKIGLHPTAIIFSVIVGSQILGVAGLFLAIPAAGIIKIIFKKFVLIPHLK